MTAALSQSGVQQADRRVLETTIQAHVEEGT